jgi:sulfopyruvate decarboxylase subunit alpha
MPGSTESDDRERAVPLVIEGLKQARVRVVVALPDSLLKGLYATIPTDPFFRYVPVANEGEGASIAAGAWAVGARSVLIMENSGLRSACEPLARLGLAVGLPVTMIMGYRGDVGEQHTYAINHGMTMEPLLRTLRIPYLMVDNHDAIVPSIVRAVIHATTSLHHVALVLRKPLV